MMSDKKLPVEFRGVFDTERDARLAMEMVKRAHVAHAPTGPEPVEMWARAWDSVKQRVAECHAAIDQHADLCSAECWPEVSKRLLWVLAELIAHDPRERGELCYRGPLPWWTLHSQDCGTKHRGCAPDCPKDARERQLAAQEQAKGRQEVEAMERRVRGEIYQRFMCAHCGPGVKADEDGCCATCGMDCTVERGVIPPRPAEYVEPDPFEE